MIFRRKKPTAAEDAGEPVMRGRDTAKAAGNPLARRFHPDDEPDTVDLQQPARFSEEPDTADSAAPDVEPEGLSVITLVAETGKFYVQPGPGGESTLLGDEPVTAPTELRRGDRIRVRGVEIHISPAGTNRGEDP